MEEIKSGVLVVKTRPSRLHSIEDHNFWINRNGKCPYCHNGSKPVPKAMIVESLKKERGGFLL